MTQPRLADPHPKANAADRPCEMYRDHGSSPPIRTQGHHARPEYLQRRLWGAVHDRTIMWLCGTCHDSAHAWIDWLLGEAYRPPTPPPRIEAYAQRVVAWYRSGPPVPQAA